MRILLLGSTGRTGKNLLQQALERGHDVHALVRDKKKIRITNDRLAVFEGSPLDAAALAQAMTGCEAILSTLNISRYNDWPWTKLRTPKHFLSSVMKIIIQLAPQHGIERIIFTSAWGAAETRKDLPGWFRWLIEHSNIRYPYDDHAAQEELIRATTLQWTSVRPAGLTNFKGKKPVVVSFHNEPKPRWTITRSNVARFMLDALEQDLYIRRAPVIFE